LTEGDVSIRKLVERDLKERWEMYRSIARRLSDDLEALPHLAELTFEVTIASRWKEEKNITHICAGPISKALQEAIQTFKSANKRGDVQGDYLVKVILPGGSKVIIPPEYYLRYQQKYGASK